MTYAIAIQIAQDTAKRSGAALYVFEITLYGNPCGEYAVSYDRPTDGRAFDTIN